jgi:amino acid adenylation domain-containing protein
VPTAVRLQGVVDIPALERSFNEIIHRHEILRTTFVASHGQPSQVIAPQLHITLPLIDLQDLPEAEHNAAIVQRAIAETQRPFDLIRGPLLRAEILRLSETDHALILMMHHIICDGWSTGLLIRELATLYAAYSVGKPSPLAEPPLQYADFAVWQRQWLQGDVLEKQLNYWRTQLGEQPPVLELPTDHLRPAIQTARGAKLFFELSHSLSDGLTALSIRHDATLFMTLLAGFYTLLYRYTDQEDLIVGSPIANRNRAEIEGVLGFFVNTLVLRTDISDNPTFEQLLRQVKAVASSAYEHQDLPFEKLVEELQPERDLSQTPLFQVMFAVQNAPEPNIALPGLTISLVEFDSRAAPFDLMLEMWESEQGLRGVFTYNVDLFDGETIARMAEHFQILLTAAVAQPHTPVAALPLLAPADTRALAIWNATAAPVPAHATLPALLAHAAATTAPHACALRTPDGGSLTYPALFAHAYRLAHLLQQHGAAPDHPVAILLPRAAHLLPALLATLAAGAPYLPLDPAYPADRLALMLADARVPLIVTTTALQPLLPPTAAHLLLLDAPATQAALAALPTTAPPLASLQPDHLAYLIYTSGSTGRPKGVAIPHRSVVTFLTWATQTFSSADLAGVLAATSVCFDLSIFELFAPLLVGGTVILADTALALPEHPAAAQVTLINTVPSAITELLRLDAIPSRVRIVNLAGEALPGALVDQLYQRDHIRTVYNLYGPSEDTTYSTGTVVTPGTRVPPIGRPLPNTQVYILDRQQRPAPLGVPGELYLASASLARGYVQQPGLTAERFVPDGVSGAVGGRLYRTGDVARWRADGQLEFLGRRDQQVKLRGYRIELGEIEAALRTHPGVTGAVVLVRETPGRGQRLVAYVAVAAGAEVTTAGLQAHVQRTLAGYMVPQGYVLLEALPLTPNGKVDRKALPAEVGRGGGPPAGAVAPRTAEEAQLAALWAGVLGLDTVGVTDNFFALGGHSLLATQVLSQTCTAFNVKLPLRAIFEHPTVAEMAQLLRRETTPAHSGTLVQLKTTGVQSPFFCVHPVGGSVFSYVDLAHQLNGDRPFYGLQAQGLEEGQPLHHTVEAMASSYLEAIRSVQPEGPYLLGGWSMGGLIAYEMAQQLTAQGQTVALLTLIDTYAPAIQPSHSLSDDDLIAAFAYDLGLPIEQPALSTERYASMEHDQRYVAILSAAQDNGLLPAHFTPADIRRLFDVFRNNLSAMDMYQPQPYPGALTLLRADEALYPNVLDPTLGWGALACDGVEVHCVPGTHYTLMSTPNVQRLAAQLEASLQRATQ